MKLHTLLIVASMISSSAYADGNVTFQVVDHGDAVEVIAHNLAMKNANVSPIRSRLEIPITGSPIASKQVMQDSTVLQVELDGLALSVKTKLERPEVHELAKLATATQVGDDIHLMFPRHAQIAATTAAPTAAPTTKPTTTATAKPVVAPPPPAAPTPTPAPAPVAIEKPIAAPISTPPPAIKKPIPPERRDWSGTGMYALAALGALGTAGYLMKKKQKTTVATSTIDVVAQRTLGSKAKVVWLAAGQREMIVAVTGTQVRMLGQWPRGTTSAPIAELPTATAKIESVPEKPVSPSVAGILKLRAATQGRTPTLPQIPAITDDEPDVDIEWAKEILTATGRR